ncbi:Hypothetical_protein [Hexamita inflata]|uniref:Hypothetical_protein n=1 Tax=Hexamita inflata TaxID=28002 RepID=A0AA86RIH0_9EUKA|nr:Hypothetical protein HINF_LOCUS63025 [Hexamita inflata]CAI9975383.1 Hypothetical protein HINF_LOCUS63028 [Hexamita inflata]
MAALMPHQNYNWLLLMCRSLSSIPCLILKSNAWRRQAMKQSQTDNNLSQLGRKFQLNMVRERGPVHYCAERICELRSEYQCKRTQKKGTRPLTRMFGLPDDNANDKNCVIAFTQLQRFRFRSDSV